SSLPRRPPSSTLFPYTTLFRSAHSYLEAFCQPGDRILTLGSEHHSNFVPWQQLCKRQGLDFQVVPILPSGQPDWAWFRQALSPRSEEHTSELQSRFDLVCRLLL